MLNTKFMMSDTTVHVIKMNSDTALDSLPPRVYTLAFSQLQGFYLTITKEQLQLPSKIYGNTHTRVDKCIQSYIDRPMSTGILMTGDKGTGKTLLMSLLANEVIHNLELPVILIRDAYEGDQFITFIETLGECCLVFDEFGKMYKSNNHHGDGVRQDSILSLMDGLDKTKRMIIMTENDEFDISEFIYNRPSRVYYHFRYKKLDEESVIDYCTDHDVETTYITDIVDLSRRSRIFSFDMLQSIVEEYLRFGQPLSEVIDDLNIDIKQEDEINIEILKIMNKETGRIYALAPGQSQIVKKPIYDYEYIAYIDPMPMLQDKMDKMDEMVEVATISPSRNSVPQPEAPKVTNKKDNVRNVCITKDQLVYESAGQLIYEDEDMTVVAKEMPAYRFNYQNLF